MRHLDRQLGQVDDRLIHMADLVAKALDLAVDGLKRPRPDLGTEAREIEAEVDALEGALERDCHELLALNAPVAGDLRHLMVALRITLLLEDIGDEAESVARRARYLARHEVVERPQALLDLADQARLAFAQAITVLRSGDSATAKSLFARKEYAAERGQASYEALAAAIRADGAHAKEWSHLLRATGRLRTIFDRCKELVEEGWFLHHRTSLRHHHEKLA